MPLCGTSAAFDLNNSVISCHSSTVQSGHCLVTITLTQFPGFRQDLLNNGRAAQCYFYWTSFFSLVAPILGFSPNCSKTPFTFRLRSSFSSSWRPKTITTTTCFATDFNLSRLILPLFSPGLNNGTVGSTQTCFRCVLNSFGLGNFVVVVVKVIVNYWNRFKFCRLIMNMLRRRIISISHDLWIIVIQSSYGHYFFNFVN